MWRDARGGLNSKVHAVCDGDGKPVAMLLTEGQVSDHREAETMLDALPEADVLIADKGYDSDRFREALRVPSGSLLLRVGLFSSSFMFWGCASSPAPHGKNPASISARCALLRASHSHTIRTRYPKARSAAVFSWSRCRLRISFGIQ